MNEREFKHRLQDLLRHPHAEAAHKKVLAKKRAAPRGRAKKGHS